MNNSDPVRPLHASPLVVAISSRALFDLQASHEVFENEGLEAYEAYQRKREDDILAPGKAFSLVQKLLGLNDLPGQHPGVEVILSSRNSADTGLRIFNSIEHYGLDIQRAVFTNGTLPARYMQAMRSDLFLSTHSEDVKGALREGFAAAMVLPGSSDPAPDGQLKIAFDGDAVLFSDEAERIYQEQGLEAFSESERSSAGTPLNGGPFKRVLAMLHDIQSAYPMDNNPIRTALVTARSAPAHKRVILTLRHWGVRIDEAMFLGGKDKGPYLAAFGADIFFDDQQVHCDSAVSHVTTAHVPHGVVNEGT